MASSRSLHRATPQITRTLRLFSSSSSFSSTSSSSAAAKRPSHRNNHSENHVYLEANPFLGSWKAPKDPKEAERLLARFRRDYAKQVKEVRKEYIKEVELMRLEKLRKDEARKEALRIQNEERKKQKAEAAIVRAHERQRLQEELRQTLVRPLSLSHDFGFHYFEISFDFFMSIKFEF